mmetsp:Transcript_18946/g.23320  ORF Transcript_18946/g.23320 Transcript_18946/m.23320 type:complete len:452 (+) Transcript_18946:29-1384(+)
MLAAVASGRSRLVGVSSRRTPGILSCYSIPFVNSAVHSNETTSSSYHTIAAASMSITSLSASFRNTLQIGIAPPQMEATRTFATKKIPRRKRPRKIARLRTPFRIPTPANPVILSRYPEDAIYPTITETPDEELARTMLARWKEAGGAHSGMRKRPLKVAHTFEAFEEEKEGKIVWAQQRRKRVGAIGLKLGMIPVWDDWGIRYGCTVLHLDSNVVLSIKTKAVDGYDAVRVGAGEYKAKNVNKPLRGIYESWGVMDHPPYVVKEFRVTPIEGLDVVPPVGTVIHARHFVPGQAVDVASTSKGKGFQGAMKRHNFKGMPASHGVSKSHRALGSTGQCQDPGRVFKGKKMAGRMGGKRVTTQNMRIIKVDRGQNLIYVLGAVPGPPGRFVEIRDAVKRPFFGTAKVEGAVELPPLPTFAYEEGIDGCGKIGDFEVMKPLEEKDPMPEEPEAA